VAVVKIVVVRESVIVLEGVIGQAVLGQEVQVIPENVNGIEIGIVIVVARKVQQRGASLFQILLMNTAGKS
jgi:hypothetical protein